MKKILLIILFIFPLILPAQNFYFGVKGGLNLASYKGEDNGGLYKAGAYAGLFVNYQFTDILSVQTEMVYSQQGSRDHINGESVTTTLDYLTMPLLLQFSLRNYEQFKFVLGPQVAYLLNSKEDPDIFTEESNPLDFLFKKSSVYEDFDYGAVVGMEYEASDHFLVDARYYLGISEFFNQAEVQSSAKHSVFSIGVAYRF